MENSDKEEFILFLKRKKCGVETRKLYLLYYRKMVEILQGSERDLLDQQVVNALLDLYPHALARAFLKNYIEYKDLPFKIQKITGTPAKKLVETIPEEDIDKIRKELYSRDERFGLIFDLSEGCALRRQEALNIKCHDLSTQTIDGEDALFILLKKTKGDKERKVFVPEQTSIKVVRFMVKNKLLMKDYLFRSKRNPERHIDKTTWNKAFTKASLNATGKRYHPHQLRHHRSLTWFNKGIDIVRIQQRLGHSNIGTTRLYINPDYTKELENWSKEKG